MNHFDVTLVEKAATLTVESGSPAASLVDFIPALRHIPTWAPFAEFKRKALETRVAVEEMMNIPFEMVKKQMVYTVSFDREVEANFCISVPDKLGLASPPLS
ncbi:hypothetical protein C0992_011779 [Termitomyces sp. T32_za158]|nr:hypothetical protein C0992_011779 [Termitomyces sp. T32_za158]